MSDRFAIKAIPMWTRLYTRMDSKYLRTFEAALLQSPSNASVSCDTNVYLCLGRPNGLHEDVVWGILACSFLYVLLIQDVLITTTSMIILLTIRRNIGHTSRSVSKFLLTAGTWLLFIRESFFVFFAVSSFCSAQNISCSTSGLSSRIERQDVECCILTTLQEIQMCPVYKHTAVLLHKCAL